MSDSSLIVRARGRYESRRADFEHRFRTDLGTRNRAFAWATAGPVAVALAALVIRPGGWSASVVVATVVAALVVRMAMLRPDTPPHAHGLPGVPEPRRCPPSEPPGRSLFVLGVRWLAALSAVVVAVGAPTAMVWATVTALVVAAVPVLADKAVLWTTRLRLRRALAAYEPRFVLGYGGYGGGPIHVGMWQPYLRASGDRGVIVGLRDHYCAELRAGIQPQFPWISTGSDVLGDMRVMTVPTITTFFYVHNAPGHLKLMGIRSVRHVWLGHGDSDKAGSHHERHRRYDVLVASGSAAVDRYAQHGVDIPAERFVLLGRPQSGEVLPATVPITEVERPRVLYTPTWTGNGKMTDFSSIRIADQVLRHLIDAGADVIFRVHPVFLRDEAWAARVARLDAILAADDADPTTPGRHVWGQKAAVDWSVADCMNAADALVSDVSSVVSDWLASDKPYLVISMVHPASEVVDAVPVAAGGHVVDQNLTGIDEALDEMLHRDPLAGRRHEVKVHTLGKYEGHESAEAFAAWVHETVHVPVSRAL